MGLVCLIFSFFLTYAEAAAPDWEPLARDLLHENAEAEAAKKQLLSLKTLDGMLVPAMDKGGESEQLALLVVRKLRMKNFVNELLSRVSKYDPIQDRTAPYVLTLITFTDEADPGDKIVDELLKKVPMTSAKISAALRISVMTAALNREKALPAKDLIELLEDPSYDMRIKAVDSASLGASKTPKEYLSFFKKALFVTPFPVRLKSAESVDSLPADDKKTLKSEVEKCFNTDSNETVRQACKSVRF